MQAESSGDGSSFVNINSEVENMAGTEPESAGEASGLGEEEVEYEEVEEEVEYEEGEEEEEEASEAPAGDDSKPKESDSSKPESKAPEAAEPEAAKEGDKEDTDSEEVPPPPASKPAKDAPASSSDAGEEPAAAAPSSSSELAAVSESAVASSSGAGGDLDFKNLEAQAAKVAQAAKDMSSKLTAGLRSAFGGTETAGTAGASLSKLAGGLTSWWGSLDPAPQPVRDETAERVASSNKASGELQQLFGLGAEENLVEHFKCKLLQTYACSHNSHTPAIQMAFQGTLYVTDKHTCFSVEERGRKLPFKVPHSAVVKATRQRPARKGDLSDLLKMELGSGQWLAFKDFESGSALDSALALVEHLMEGN